MLGWRSPRILVAVSFAISLISQASGDWVNRTIDDENGDEVSGLKVTYAPDGFWAQGAGCGGCAFKPNASRAYDGTWHDGSRYPDRDQFPLQFTFRFNGTAFYIYTIEVRETFTDVNITLDGTLVGNYTKWQDLPETEQALYSVPIFGKDSIPYGDHTVTVSAFGSNETHVLFDYAVYTTNATDSDTSPSPVNGSGSSGSSESNTSQPKHSSNTGPIVGGVVGGIALIALLILGWFCFRRRSRTASDTEKKLKPKPFPLPISPSTTSPSKEPSEYPITSPGLSYTTAPLQSPTRNPEKFTIDIDRDQPTPGPAPPMSIIGSDSGVTPSLGYSSPSSATSTSFTDQIRALRADLATIRGRSLAPPTQYGDSSTIASSSVGARSYVPADVSSEHSDRTDTDAILKELASLRAEVESAKSSPRDRPTSNVTSPLKYDIASLRAEIAQLRAREEEKRPIDEPITPDGRVLHELAALRAEMEDIRMQHDFAYLGPLPDYSPPQNSSQVTPSMPPTQ